MGEKIWRRGMHEGGKAKRTKLTEGTKNAILVIEGLHPATKKEVEEAVKELGELIKKFCGGDSSYSIFDHAY